MLSVYQVTLPTPYKVGPVNIYVIKNRPVTLIDAGADTPEAYKMLRHMLPQLGVNINEIKRVILTHSHPDHSGLAAKISAESGAAVIAHQLEIKKLTSTEDSIEERLPHVLETGIPTDALQAIQVVRDKLPRPALVDKKMHEVQDGSLIEFENGVSLQVLHLPGHSPGHVCLYSPEQNFFFSGDFMLPHITPNPLMEPDLDHPGRRMPTLSQYLQGLERVEKMDISVVFPGHGGTFSDYHGVIDTVRGHHDVQVKLILEMLKGQDLNTYQLSRKTYPNLGGWDVFLGLSEIQANLDLMLKKQLIGSYKRNGVVYYQTAD
ncbi:MAG TPA: MBL fold metallo-hydrolase [Desulfotomaculum sp.]|nr:MAG: hypothetical protein JL56_00580 [Desulfotomaculum sp. BICA1-6]HBX23805.1 MBL fold metallo-hydrolase [Desulfotomaculum sp.]